MRRGLRSGRGVALIEALVSFGVLAFGLMAVLGMQATLRGNSDGARQRAEAVRIAQDAMEEWRGFTKRSTTADRRAYADLVPVPDTTISGTNATYTLSRQANDAMAVAGTVTPLRRTLVVNVSWADRAGVTQRVQLSSTVGGVEPELTASLVLASSLDPTLAPRGRHRAVPVGAVPLGQGRSGFVPPGQTGPDTRVAWVFDNTTGVITLCTTVGLNSADLQLQGSAPVCGTQKALLVAGYIRFATDSLGLPSSVADPQGPDFPSFSLRAVAPTATAYSNGTCFQDPIANNQVRYYCAVPTAGTPLGWSGNLVFGDIPLASAVAGVSASEFKLCRYFNAASSTLTYSAMTSAKLSQNFLVIRAGNNSSAFQCPTASTPRTWAHQPAT